MAGIPATADVTSVAYGPGSSPLFVAVGVSDYGAAVVSAGGSEHLGSAWLSADGTSWSAVPISTARFVWDVVLFGGEFVAVGSYSGQPGPRAQAAAPGQTVRLYSSIPSGNPGIWTSGDGRTWRAEHLAGCCELRRVVATDRTLVALGSTENDRAIWTSGDARTWSRTLLRPSGDVAGLVALRGSYLAAGGAPTADCPEGAAIAWTSADGGQWTAGEVSALRCAPIVSIAVGPAGAVALGLLPAQSETDVWRILASVSQDGHTWGTAAEVAQLPFSAGIANVRARVVDGVYIVTGFGAAWISTDGLQWKAGPDPPPAEPTAGATSYIATEPEISFREPSRTLRGRITDPRVVVRGVLPPDRVRC